MLNTQHNKVELSDIEIDEVGNDHISTCFNTPIRKDAFDKTDEEKIETIAKHFEAIMQTLGLDLTDDSLKGTPKRVAKMYVQETFKGLNPANKPAISMFDNKYKYNEMLVEKNISFYTYCEHHFVPFFGKAHIAYINNGQVIGLSKLNRIVDYFAKRPQVQERLTMQIGKELEHALGTNNIAVLLEAKHLCVASRGIKDDSSTTVTTYYNGEFLNSKKKEEFLKYLELNADK
ncbi:MAG: GTP cyclohydrolase I FolE [Bacteroidetes bacterium]|nr:GTP cyclohydrolase I FolE [Bacteroidota bacterium]